MTPQQANELLPCPFCGNSNAAQGLTKYVTCRACGADGPVGGHAAWNRRAPAPTSEQDAAELAEWRRLKDPAVLHASLLRGQPARLPDYVFQHIAGVAPASEPGARDAVVAVARKILQEALDGVVVHPCDEFDESVRAKGLYGHMAELYAALATPASPARITGLLKEALGWIENSSEPAPSLCCDLRKELGLPPASPAVPAAPLAPSFRPANSTGRNYDPAPLVAQASPWMPIETAPKDGTLILLGREEDLENDRGAISTPGRWHDEDDDGPDNMGHDAGFMDDEFQQFAWGRSFGNSAYRNSGFQPTCWMPLPPAPEASPLVEDAQRIVAGKVDVSRPLDVSSITSVVRRNRGERDRAVLVSFPSLSAVDRFLLEFGDLVLGSNPERATTGNATADDGKDK